MKHKKNYLIYPKAALSESLKHLELDSDFINYISQKTIIGVSFEGKGGVFAQDQAKLAFLLNFVDDFVMDVDESEQAKLWKLLGNKSEVSLGIFDSFWSIEEIELVSDSDEILKYVSSDTLGYFSNIAGYLGNWLKTKPKAE